MQQPSKGTLSDLANRYGINGGAEELEDIQAEVSGLLDGLEAVDDVPVDVADVPDYRSWRKPATNPHNAIATVCDVPPTGTGPLDGVDIGVKDIISVAGVPMECGSTLMQGFVPRTDATVVRRLLDAGATITAKTANDELATSGRGTTGITGPIANPHDPERTAGGSSGGSAAAVATGRVDAALGTDTSGSVQGPAAYCGVVGVKPSHGLVPLSGVVEHAYTLDHVGILATDVGRTADILERSAGKDTADPASLAAAGRTENRVGGYVDAVADPPALSSVEIGVIKEGIGSGIDNGVAKAFDASIDRLEDAGATVRRVSIDDYEAAAPIGAILSYMELFTHWVACAAPYRRGGTVDERYQTAFAERKADLNRSPGIYYKSKLLAGAHLLEAHDGRHYTRAQATRETVREALESTLHHVDVLAAPTKPTIAPRFDDIPIDAPTTINTRPATVARLPTVSLPAENAEGMPTGLLLTGPPFDEAALLGVAAAAAAHLLAADK